MRLRGVKTRKLAIIAGLFLLLMQAMCVVASL